MLLKKLCSDFIAKSNENFALYELLKNQNKFIEWQAVAIFYSALCITKAYLYSKGIKINSINSHDDIKFWLTSESSLKHTNVYEVYSHLYRHSRNARYLTNKRITNEIINRMLKDYQIVKDNLKIDL